MNNPIPVDRSDTAFFGHPRGLSTLFFTEMWERFSYYGMRAILILFMTAPVATGGMGYDTVRAGAVYGTYVSLVYLLALPGGWFADRILGLRRAVLYGGFVIMTGHILLAMPSEASFFLGLLCVVIGTGLLKPNISALVGTLYREGDVRRDAGFSIYYMGINLGAFLAPLAVGWLAQGQGFRDFLSSIGLSPESSWHYGFGLAAIGMGLGLIQYVAGDRHLGDGGKYPAVSDSPEEARAVRRRATIGVATVAGGLALLIGLAAFGVITIKPEAVAGAFGIAIVIITVAFFAWLFAANDWTPEERRRLMVIVVLFLAAAVFWSAFEQAGSSLNLFAQNNTRNEFFGIGFPASWFQSVNSLFIITLAPVLAWLWVWLGKRDPSTPTKFSAGLILVGAGFAVLMVAAIIGADGTRVSPMWLVVVYLLHTLGELTLSPVGLSAMTKLAPARVAGLMMGVWFLATSVGNFLAGGVVTLYGSFSQSQIFGAVTVFSVVSGLILALLIKPINRMLARRDTTEPPGAEAA